MSRRIEITVPNIWADALRDCLVDKSRCNLGDESDKPNMIVELPGYSKTLFFVTIPGAAVGPTLEHLRQVTQVNYSIHLFKLYQSSVHLISYVVLTSPQEEWVWCESRSYYPFKYGFYEA